MDPDIYPTTAENMIAATDAVLTRENGCDQTYVAQFIDVPQVNAQNALEMARQLGLVDIEPGPTPINLYRPQKPFAIYLVTAKESQRAAVLRLVLENYAPYRAFKQRLVVTGVAARAAEQIKLIYTLTPHRDEIRDTLISLGTFAQSLISEGAGLFRPADFDTQQAGFIQIVAEVAADRALAEVVIRKRLGDDVVGWVSQQEVLSPLATAYQQLGLNADARTPVVYAGNAIESFLIQLGNHYGVSLIGATGINSKVDRLGNNLNAKHKNTLKYLGHIRNAADHGVDAEIGNSWDISKESATEYTYVAVSAIKSITRIVLNTGFVI